MVVPQREARRRVSWLPSAVTAAGMTTGLIAMVLIAERRYEAAVSMLVLAIVLDILDGRLARWLRATSRLGQQLDSFNDAITFGAAPALLVVMATLRPLGFFGVLVAVTYLLAAVFRLARFNLTTDPHEKSETTLGVPSPIGAGYMMALALMRDELPAAAAAVVVLLVAVSMVSRWSLPAFTGRGPVVVALGVAIVNYLAFVVWPNWYTVIWWNLWNLVILALARRRERRLALETQGDG